ncbi:cell surface protein, putative [Trichomonas vaginalis G3]|uniref:Cell surface protein, putative n=1 Tax=Trichomonas vaginalis (strain ATCC PRA-98 / G3) TaxID=412133 RepID=A2G6K5_TRIV3|nr:ribonuclease inhibitor domain-containing protein [Trichomonas vaginalis G3]EAX87215.1 cell surface protein, putative [Trichomonas vaginalis G3]KAI5501083.1 ribonuclease inhibitor domain-containing protein [Trichomonas vaginalis G3]|eukprot:XP_001300145.1 cell surface protein [Trichomonas vaginalis G3]
MPNLLNVSLPNSIEEFDDNIFKESPTAMPHFNIPPNVIKIYEGNPFDFACIENFDVDSRNSLLSSENGILYSKNKKTLISFPICREVSSFTVPDFVENLYFGAFNRARYLEKIIFPTSITSMGEQFCYGNGIVLKQIFVYRNINQKKPYIGENSFGETSFQQKDIIYIYPSKVHKPKEILSCSFIIWLANEFT